MPVCKWGASDLWSLLYSFPNSLDKQKRASFTAFVTAITAAAAAIAVIVGGVRVYVLYEYECAFKCAVKRSTHESWTQTVIKIEREKEEVRRDKPRFPLRNRNTYQCCAYTEYFWADSIAKFSWKLITFMVHRVSSKVLTNTK